MPDADGVVARHRRLAAGDGVDSRRGIRVRRGPVSALQRVAAGRQRERGGGQHHLPNRCFRRIRAQRPGRRIRRQPRAAGPAGRVALDAGEHRRIRRRPRPGDCVRRVRRWHVGARTAGQPGRGRTVQPCDRAESGAAAGRRPRTAGETSTRVPAATRCDRRGGQGAAAAATAPRRGPATAEERRDHADTGLRTDLRRRPAATSSAGRRPRRCGGPDSADHRHQQPRGLDVRLDQAADAADHVRRRSTRTSTGPNPTPGSGCWRPTRTTRDVERWSRSAPM